MVSNATSLTNNGLRDWLIQRVSAVVMVIYIIVLIALFVCHPQMNYVTWHGLWAMTSMRLLTAVTLLSLILHAWVGIWRVSVDYLKSIVVRLTFQMIVILTLIICLIWGIAILWGT